jgi:hypothetical protein
MTTVWRNPPSISVIVICVVLLMTTLAFVTSSATVETEPCMDDEQRERVRGIVLEGIEAGLKNQVQKVFEVWMKDPGDQPRRAKVGMHEGIDAYVRSRADALRWNPPICKEHKP